MSSGLRETALRRRRVHKGRAVDFWVDTVRLPSGESALREYLGHPGAVAVLALESAARDPRLLFVRQYRYPVGEITYELPAGKLQPGENPLFCVKRELEEETGRRARRYRKILSFWPTAAFANEVIHVYVASGLSEGTFKPDDDEFIEPVSLTLTEALRMVRRGRIRDSKTIIALLAYDKWRGK